MLTDIEIAQKATLQRISELALERLGIASEHLEPYGHYKAKIHLDYLQTLQDRLGFELPIRNLRYWLLGVPDPDAPFELTRNSQDRAELLTQAGWEINYDRYAIVEGDWLPAHLVLSHAGARVRVAVDHWTFKP